MKNFKIFIIQIPTKAQVDKKIRREDLKNKISQELRGIKSNATHHYSIGIHLCQMRTYLEISKTKIF